MTLSENVMRAQAVTLELNSALQQFDISKNNSEITTNSGRTYKVANVLENKEKGTWMVTPLVSKGMFVCDQCGNGQDPKYFPADAWTQFDHGDETVRMHSKLIHQFREHPETISTETIAKTAKVFLD